MEGRKLTTRRWSSRRFLQPVKLQMLRKKETVEKKHLSKWPCQKKTTFSLCDGPFFGWFLFGIKHTTHQILALLDDFVRSGINGLNTWDRVENWGNPVGREGRVCLDYKLRSCALPETPWERDFKSSRRKRPTNICYHVDHVDLCHGWRSFLGIQICKVKKTVRKSSATMNVQFPCNSLMPKQEVLLSIYRGHIHLGCMVLPSLKSIWLCLSECFLLSKTPWNVRSIIRKYDRFLHKCCQTMRDHGTNDFQSLSKRQSDVVFPCGKKLLNGSLGLSRFLFSSTKCHGFFVGCLEISRL